eukprot:1157373-Pelagomonas_calceolata.AAC.5
MMPVEHTPPATDQPEYWAAGKSCNPCDPCSASETFVMQVSQMSFTRHSAAYSDLIVRAQAD